MSKVGKKPIDLPAGVEVSMNGDIITVKGPKGTLTRSVYPGVKVVVEGNSIQTSAEGYEMRKFR